MARHNSDGCNAKEGNPFGPFWNTFNVDFTESIFYRPLSYDVHRESIAQAWKEKFKKWPGNIF